MTIQSNAEVASQCATQIASGAIEISSVTRGTKDSSSEYTGNTDASTYIDKEASYSSPIAEQITQLVSLVQSVASEFEAVDAKLSAEIQSTSVASVSTSTSSSKITINKPSTSLPYTDYFK